MEKFELIETTNSFTPKLLAVYDSQEEALAGIVPEIVYYAKDETGCLDIFTQSGRLFAIEPQGRRKWNERGN